MTLGPHGLAALFLLSAATMPALAAPAGEPVTGRVTDATNVPLPGATVTLQVIGRPGEVYTARTNREGIYQFSELPDGNYSIEASLRGYVTVRYFPVRIRFPYGYEQDFRLPADEVFVSDTTDKAHVVGELRMGDKPVTAAQVCLRRGQEQHCATTTRFGQYSIFVPLGRWQATVKTTREFNWRQTIVVNRAGDHRDLIQIKVAPPEPARPPQEAPKPPVTAPEAKPSPGPSAPASPARPGESKLRFQPGHK